MKNEISLKLKANRILSIFTILLGVGALIYMVVVEHELGAIPILLWWDSYGCL